MLVQIVAQLIGSVIFMFIVCGIIYWSIVKRVAPGSSGWLATCVIGYVVSVVLYGLDNANGGPWNPGSGYWVYAIAAITTGAVGHMQMKRRAEAKDASGK